MRADVSGSGIAGDVLAAIEERAFWSRFGL